MAVNYADDEIMETEPNSGMVSELLKTGRVRVKVINKAELGLQQTNFKVLLEITGAEMGKDRLGVDIVTVLDVTGVSEIETNSPSKQKIEGKKKNLAEMKCAMKFLINKLSPIDRLSVVAYSRTSSQRVSPLHRMTEDSKRQIQILVNGLQVVNDSKDHSRQTAADAVTDGLQMAIRVLDERRLTTRRMPAIMLVMCTCDEPQSDTGNATQVPDCIFPVHTFGFGPKFNDKVLYQIATKSTGGTFSMADVQDTPSSSNLGVAFSQCLAGLLTVVVQELKLNIINTVDSEIKVSAGEYSQSRDVHTGSVTVSFGDLYCRENRRVMVDLLLPAVHSQAVTEVLKITYSYKIGEANFEEDKPLLSTVIRTSEIPMDQEREEVTIEAAHIRTISTMKEAIRMADNGNLDEAQDKLVEAQNMLEDIDVVDPKPSIEMLKYELYELIKLMQSKKIYESLGRVFALAAKTSHDRQRFAARGDVDGNRPRFATTFMDKFLEQVMSYEKNPGIRLQTITDDINEEIAKNPIAAFPGALSYNLEKLIQSLEAMQENVNKFR